jgi:hypothetical protein
MGKPTFRIDAPSKHAITFTTGNRASKSTLSGCLSIKGLLKTNFSQSEIHVYLVRAARWDPAACASSNTRRRFPGILGSSKPRDKLSLANAEKLVQFSTHITVAPTGSESRKAKCDFSLAIPYYLPPTTTFPSTDISYALVAECTTPDGRVLQTSQELQILRHNTDCIRLQPSLTVTYPESPLAVRVTFPQPLPDSKTAIPATLCLEGLSLPSKSCMRATETRWMVAREIQWEVEEKATVISGFPDNTGHLAMHATARSEQKRKISHGRQKLKLKYPFTRPGNTPVTMLGDTSMGIPVDVRIPKAVDLGGGTALTVAGGHVLHSVSCSEPSDVSDPGVRFALHVEYTLHIWLRMGEDIFDKATGDLVNRKMDEMAYTVRCPLRIREGTETETETNGLNEPLLVVPPAYDVAVDAAPAYDAVQ